MGSVVNLDVACWGGTGSTSCPMLGVKVHGPGNLTTPGKISSSDCIQLIRRFAGLIKTRGDFLYVQVVKTSATDLYPPPINPALVTCPADTTQIYFWFTP